MVGVDAPIVIPRARSGFERPGLIAAVVGVLAVAALILVRPDPSATSVEAGAIDVAAPEIELTGGPALQPAAVSAPKTGLYPARVGATIEGTETGGRTTSERSASLRVQEADGAPDGVAYRTIATPAGIGGDAILAFDGSGAAIIAVGTADGCVLDTPVPVWRSPMAVGDSWSGRGTCTASSGNVRSATVTHEARVIGTKSVSIFAETLDGFVIESTRTSDATTEFRSNENVTKRVEKRVEIFVPSLGLPVEYTSNATTVTGGGRTTVTTELMLLGTEPRAGRVRGPGGRQGGQ